MTLEIIALVIAICIAVVGTLFALLAAEPRETLDEQAEWIRRNREEREAKQQAREAKRRRKKT